MLCLNDVHLPGARGIMSRIGALLTVVCCLATAGCAPTEDTSYLTPPAEATLDAFDWKRPIETKRDAVIVGTSLLNDGRRVPLEPPQILYVGESNRNEAANRLYNTTGIAYEDWPEDEMVWLVITKGKWHIYGPPSESGPSEPALIQGCAYALFYVNGEPISSGGVACPP
jgi:hypothetical protein